MGAEADIYDRNPDPSERSQKALDVLLLLVFLGISHCMRRSTDEDAIDPVEVSQFGGFAIKHSLFKLVRLEAASAHEVIKFACGNISSVTRREQHKIHSRQLSLYP